MYFSDHLVLTISRHIAFVLGPQPLLPELRSLIHHLLLGLQQLNRFVLMILLFIFLHIDLDLDLALQVVGHVALLLFVAKILLGLFQFILLLVVSRDLIPNG